MKRFQVIYLITNLINNKIYIGKHITDDLNDNYFGSGTVIKQAIKKYGLENFTKTYLLVKTDLTKEEHKLKISNSLKKIKNNICL